MCSGPTEQEHRGERGLFQLIVLFGGDFSADPPFLLLSSADFSVLRPCQGVESVLLSLTLGEGVGRARLGF